MVCFGRFRLFYYTPYRLTTATVDLSKDSDLSFIMVVYENYFESFDRNEEIVAQNNISEKYYKLRRSKLHCNI